MKAILFLATGFEEIEAVASMDILRRGGVDLRTISIMGDLSVESAHNVFIKADALLNDCDCSDADMLLLPGGGLGTENLSQDENLSTLLTQFAQENKWIAAICAAPSILGRLGILKNHKATCYPGFEDALIGAEICSDPVVVSGNIITGKGPGYSIPFALEVLSQLEGREVATEIAKALLIQ